MAITENYVSAAGGGAHDGSTEADAFSWAEMVADINGAGAGGRAGIRFNIKGTISRTTTTDTLSTGGTSTSPLMLRGYGTTIGDGYQGRTSSNGPLVTTNLPALSYTTGQFTIGVWTILEAMDVDSEVNGAAVVMAADSAIVNCRVTNSGTGGSGVAVTQASHGVLLNCDCSLTGASGGLAAITSSSVGAKVLCNRISGGAAIGLRIASSGAAVGNVIYASSGNQIAMNSTAGYPLIFGNTLVGGAADGIDIVTGTTVLQCVVNNMITDNGGYGIDGVSAANAIFAAYNRTRDNTSGADNLATDWLAATKYGHVTTDTGGAETDYVDAGSDDYNLISGSPAKETGILYPASIGALQFHATGGGGGGYVIGG